ncbi:hypothetical protein GCM10011363_39510 [Marivita lacus]|uniref:Uncharacterized protein n=1 Tax=Marivita lacus TaxID=1323742 RepID=A0ABQ1L6G4_9RHOB|nr:hypothetical protein GCM10011363_39510 [Marivita lacus]
MTREAVPGCFGGAASGAAKTRWKPHALEEIEARDLFRGDLLDLGKSDVVGCAFDGSVSHRLANLAITSDQEIKTQDLGGDVSAG